MLEKLKNFIRGWRDKVINKSSLKEVAPVNPEQESRVILWKALYKGVCDEIHKVRYNTIEKQGFRYMLSLGIPKIVCEELARLMFNEKAEINIGDEKVKIKVDEVLKKNRFDKRFQQYLEKGLALGGLIVKAHWNDRTKLSFVLPDAFIPLGWTDGKINSCIFISETVQGEYHYTRLEYHTWEGCRTYLIKNELYESKYKSELGHRVELSKVYPDLKPEVSINGLTEPLFEYFKPNIANNFDLRSPEGISIYANSIDTIKSIDTAFDSFHREFKLGKKRIIVPSTAIRTVIDPNTGIPNRYFDANDEVYEAMNIGDMDADKITDIKVELRVEEHINAIQNLLDVFAMQIGFSSGAFTFTGGAVKTATEIISMQSKTFRTLVSHEIELEEFLIGMVRVILDVETLYTGTQYNKDYEISVEFDDSIIKDKEADLEYILKLKTAGLMTDVEAIVKSRGLTEEEAIKVVEQVKEQRSNELPDVTDLYGE